MPSQTVLLGRGSELVAAPDAEWRRELARMPPEIASLLSFMTPDHHRIRNFVVRALPEIGSPIAPNEISRQLDIPPERVAAVLDDLERNLFFLYRNASGAVAWAYPVTAEATEHRLEFDSGERLWAA